MENSIAKKVKKMLDESATIIQTDPNTEDDAFLGASMDTSYSEGDARTTRNKGIIFHFHPIESICEKGNGKTGQPIPANDSSDDHTHEIKEFIVLSNEGDYAHNHSLVAAKEK